MIDLLGTQMTIGEVATRHGFPSIRSYNETFPRFYGKSPAEYRRRHQRETVFYQDFAGEEVALDYFSGEDGQGNMIPSGSGYGVTVRLPEGSYEVLCVETEDKSVRDRTALLNVKNRIIDIDCDCDELILRIRKR